MRWSCAIDVGTRDGARGLRLSLAVGCWDLRARLLTRPRQGTVGRFEADCSGGLFDSVAVFVDLMVMAVTQGHEVVERCWAAVLPRNHVVDLAPIEGDITVVDTASTAMRQP